jgi:hypothetical protein
LAFDSRPFDPPTCSRLVAVPLSPLAACPPSGHRAQRHECWRIDGPLKLLTSCRRRQQRHQHRIERPGLHRPLRRYEPRRRVPRFEAPFFRAERGILRRALGGARRGQPQLPRADLPIGHLRTDDPQLRRCDWQPLCRRGPPVLSRQHYDRAWHILRPVGQDNGLMAAIGSGYGEPTAASHVGGIDIHGGHFDIEGADVGIGSSGAVALDRGRLTESRRPAASRSQTAFSFSSARRGSDLATRREHPHIMRRLRLRNGNVAGCRCRDCIHTGDFACRCDQDFRRLDRVGCMAAVRRDRLWVSC